MSTIETAIRLSIPSEKAHLLGERLRGAKACERTSRVYFDTDRLDLRALDVELSVRKSGGKILQTIKTPVPMGGAFAKTVSRHDLDSDEPCREHLTGIANSKRLSEAGLSTLRPLFRATVEQTTGEVRDSNGAADLTMSMIVGSMERGARTQDICEVALALRGGPVVGLYDAALNLLLAFGARLSVDGPMNAADLAFEPQAPLYWKPPKPALDPASSLRDAVRQALRHAYTQILKNYVPMMSQGDAEAVHQMRVGIRRLRSIMFAFKPVMNPAQSEPLMEEAKTLFARLGELRELDVFLADLLPRAFAALDDPVKRRLASIVQARRAALYDRLGDQLSSSEFSVFALKLGRWIESGEWQNLDSPLDRLWYVRPLRVYAQTRLMRLHRKMTKLGGSKRKDDFKDWHELRIMTKKLRYTAEFFAVLFPAKQADAYNRKLAMWQERLGELNDMASSRTLLRRLEEQAQGSDVQALRDARLYFSGWSQDSAKRMEKDLVRRWRGFSRTEPYWLEAGAVGER